MTSICSFIACISTRIGGGVVSKREGMLKFRRSALRPFKSPSFGVVPLVFLLDVVSRIPLSQLLLQIMVLFREAFYRSREGLDLSF